MQKTGTKQDLINATRELIATGENFTVKEITSRAYTNVAAINYYFGDKNTLVNSVLQDILKGFRSQVMDELRKDHGGSEEYIESFLNLVARIYAENKGVIRYIVTADTGNKSYFIDNFLFDPELTDLVFEKMAKNNDELDPKAQLCNYMIAMSAFITPLLFEVQNPESDGVMSLSSLQSEGMRSVFVKQLMKLFE